MRKAVRLGLMATALMFASPAMASDFSGLIYVFGVAFAIIGVVVMAALWVARRTIGNPGPITDAVSAIALGLTFAPTTFVYAFGEWDFILWPAWMFAVLGDTWSGLFPGPATSVVVTSALIYLFFKSRRQPSTSKYEGGLE